MRLFLNLIWILFLTLLTQVGGLIWIISLFISHKSRKRKRIIFPVLYLLFNLLIVPPLAKLFGRERLPVFSDTVKSKNWFYPILFRNYVDPELKQLLIDTYDRQYNGITITYLDANFPFINEFPLLPHLSHNDGKKIDIAFMYKDENGKKTNKKPSLSGYGTFVNSENNITTKRCIDEGYWQYDYPKYLTFGTNKELTFDAYESKRLITSLLSQPMTQKIFIEPHLKVSLGLENEAKIRFHGCGAVRHDDHIHLQIE